MAIREALPFAWLLICSSSRLKVESLFLKIPIMHLGYLFFLWNAFSILKQRLWKVTDQEIRLLQLSMSLQLTAGRKMVGCDVRYTDMQGKIQGALEHLQEGTRESKPRMGTGHQQQHWTYGWCGVHASQCRLACGHLRLAGRGKHSKSKRYFGWIMASGLGWGLGKPSGQQPLPIFPSSTGKWQQASIFGDPSPPLPYPFRRDQTSMGQSTKRESSLSLFFRERSMA